MLNNVTVPIRCYQMLKIKDVTNNKPLNACLKCLNPREIKKHQITAPLINIHTQLMQHFYLNKRWKKIKQYDKDVKKHKRFLHLWHKRNQIIKFFFWKWTTHILTKLNTEHLH